MKIMSYLSEVSTVFRNAIRVQSIRLCRANYSKSATPKDDEVYNEDDEGKFNVNELLVDEEVDSKKRERQIERMRNKSRLRKTHRNLLYDLPQPLDEYPWDHTVAFSRTQYGRYGAASGVDPRLCFYTPSELADKQEYERVAYPYTIQQMIEMNKQEKAEKDAKIRERERKIATNLTKLDKWMADLNERVAKKEEEVRLAKEKRERMLEDIRQEIGFKIDYKDPRFKALMEQKEIEAKKMKKKEKKQKREELLIEKLKEQAKATLEETNAKTAAAATADETDEKDEAAVKKQAKTKAKSKKSKDKESKSSDSDSDGEKEEKKEKE